MGLMYDYEASDMWVRIFGSINVDQIEGNLDNIR